MSFTKDKKAFRKTSIGIALCRRASVPQILLVKSRITYNFASFVLGRYKLWDTEKLQFLFNNTTQGEKLLIWSCDFSKLWYHVWLKCSSIEQSPSNDTFYQFYINCRSKFDKLISKEGGRRIKNLLNKSHSIELGWEIPKGRQEINEKELDCGIRELYEETGVSQCNYNILHNIKPICASHEDDNVIYIYKYYVAWTDKIFDPVINYNNLTQISEIEDLKWVSLHEANCLTAQNKNLKQQVKLALKLFKRETRPIETVPLRETP